MAGAWRRFNKIHERESRAAVAGLRVEVRSGTSRGSTVLSLGDNMPEVCSLDRGRASDRALNMQARRAASLQLFGDVVWRRRHMPGKLNVADGGSRLADAGALQPGEVVYGASVTGLLNISARRVSHHAMPPGQFCLELFAGTSRLSAAWAEAGLRVAPPLDLGRGTDFDLQQQWLKLRLFILSEVGHAHAEAIPNTCP